MCCGVGWVQGQISVGKVSLNKNSLAGTCDADGLKENI